MARNIPAALKAHLAQTVTTMTQCLAIERADGKRILLTKLNKPVIYDGEIYASSPSFSSSAIKVSSDLSADNMTIQLALDGTVFTEEEFRSHVYDDAEFELFALNWESPDDGVMSLSRGWAREIKLERNKPYVTVSIRGMTSLLNKPFMEKYSKTCRAMFGDRRCMFALSPYDNLYQRNNLIPTGKWYIEPAAWTDITLLNASFETDGIVAAGDSISDWTQSNGSLFEVVLGGKESSYALANYQTAINKIYKDFTPTSTGISSAAVDTGLHVVGMSAWVKKDDADGGQLRFSIYMFDANGNTLRVKRSKWQAPTETDVYEQYALSTPLIPGTRNVRLMIETRGYYNPAALLIDEVEARRWQSAASFYDYAYKSVKLLSYSTNDEKAPDNYQFSADGEVGAGTSGISNWTYGSGAVWAIKQTLGAISSTYGGYFLYSNSGVSQDMSQIISLSDISSYIANDPTGFFCEFAAWAASPSSGTLQLTIEYLDESDVVIDTVTSAVETVNTTTWTRIQVNGEVPQNAVNARVTLTGGGTAIAVDKTMFYIMSQYISSNNDILQTRTGDDYIGTLSPTSGLNYDNDSIVWKQQDIPFEFGYILDVTDNATFESSVLTGTRYGLGTILFLSGQNAGLKVSVMSQSGNDLTLFTNTPYDITSGDNFVVFPSCNKTIEQCGNVYDNAINFRGEPFIPGNATLAEILET